MQIYGAFLKSTPGSFAKLTIHDNSPTMLCTEKRETENSPLISAVALEQLPKNGLINFFGQALLSMRYIELHRGMNAFVRPESAAEEDWMEIINWNDHERAYTGLVKAFEAVDTDTIVGLLTGLTALARDLSWSSG